MILIRGEFLDELDRINNNNDCALNGCMHMIKVKHDIKGEPSTHRECIQMEQLRQYNADQKSMKIHCHLQLS